MVTGSAGKTTLLHLLEAQLGKKAHYSHNANSSFGISFDILGMSGVKNSRVDWLKLFLLAPFKAFSSYYPEKIYIAEADVDRPYEGKFLAGLLKPSITLWVSSLHTHAAQFGDPVHAERKIAEEYGNFAQAARQLLIIDGDNPLMVEQAKRSKAEIQPVVQSSLKEYTLGEDSTTFRFDGVTYTLPALMPKATFYQVAMVDRLLKHFEIVPDYQYEHFQLPPGRSKLFEGIKGIKIIDSTYNNSNIETLRTVVEMFEFYLAPKKWLIVGDMLEQGANEGREHAKIAQILNAMHFERIVLVGPRTREYTLPGLSEELKARTIIKTFDKPADVYNYLSAELKGGEILLFKSVRFMEGVIEKLLKNPADADKLPRRGRIWDKRRQEWGL